MALNKKDGALIWKSQNEKAGYSSAIASKLPAPRKSSSSLQPERLDWI